MVVNTCGFYRQCRAGVFDAIGEAMRGERPGDRDRLYGREGKNPRPVPGGAECVRPHQYDTVVNAVHEYVPPQHDPFVDLIPPQGVKLTPQHYAYIKISEGCNQSCTFALSLLCGASW